MSVRGIAVLTSVVLLGSCRSAVVEIGASPTTGAQLAAKDLALELGSRGIASHVTHCSSTRSCLSRLSAGELDVVIAVESSVRDFAETRVVGPTGGSTQAIVVPSSDSGVQSLRELASRGSALCIATTPELRLAPSGGLSDLLRTYGLSNVERREMKEPASILAAIDNNECDVALIDSSERVGRYRAMADPRSALASEPLVVAARAGDDRFVEATKKVTTRIGKTADAEDGKRILIPRTRDADFAINALARSLNVSLVEVDDPAASIASGEASLAIVAADKAEGGSASSIAIFDRGRGQAFALVSPSDALTETELEKILASTMAVRLPSQRPLSPQAQAPSAASSAIESPWLDSFVNVTVVGFLVWLILVVVRRKPD